MGTMTLEKEEKEQKVKMELLEAVDEQKAYIEQLEAENQKLMTSKIKDDDQMFLELKHLRTHRFARSMQMDAISNLAPSEYDGNHSRGPSVSMSNYSNSGFGYGVFNHHANESNAGLQLKAIRTQINLLYEDPEEFNEEMEDEETIEVKEEPVEVKKVSFKVTSKDNKELQEKEDKKRKKMEEMFKVNAEIEFFLLTCIAVKANLVEEYPDKPEVMTENAMELFEDAQKEHVVMSKFNLWIELKLRNKYDLPKLEGFNKFLDKYGIKDGLKKTKEKSKKLAKNAKKAGGID